MEYLSNYKGLIKSKKSENFEEFPEVSECSIFKKKLCYQNKLLFLFIEK
jgi:hypothetical protein